MLFWVPDQNNALRFSGFQPEARLRATLGQDAPHGLGVSDPSPCAPPRQADRPGPFEHSVEGFCGAARVEWAGPVWAKNRLGRALGSVSLVPDQTDRRLRLPRVFSGLRPEARHAPRRPCGLPHGLGVGDPSPCAPPRQAGKSYPIGHRREGVLLPARVEWAWLGRQKTGRGGH